MADRNPFLPGAGSLEPEKNPSIIEWSARSQSGTKKPVNEDSWLAFASDLSGATVLQDSGQHSLSSHDLIFAVSDGMGGGKAGDVASKMLLETLSSLIPETFQAAAAGMHPDYFNHLEQTIVSMHQAINEEGKKHPCQKGMAATLALAWFTPENLYLANVGDSRIYLHRSQGTAPETTLLTQDHTFAWRKMQRGEINEREYRKHPRRSTLYEVVGGGHSNVKPYVASIPYQSGDKFLLCSDGLVDGLWEKHIHSTFSDNRDSTSHLTDSLITRAIENDGSDDTTLITLTIL